MLLFLFVLRHFLIYSLISFLTQGFFLVACYLVSICLCFSHFFLWLIFTFIHLWLENIFDMISTLLYLLRLVLWLNMWSVLENVPCALEKLCILLFWDGMSCLYLLSSTDKNVSFMDTWVEKWRGPECLGLHFCAGFTRPLVCAPWLESGSGLEVLVPYHWAFLVLSQVCTRTGTQWWHSSIWS